MTNNHQRVDKTLHASDSSAIGTGRDNEVKLITKHRNNSPVSRSPTRYPWTTAPAPIAYSRPSYYFAFARYYFAFARYYFAKARYYFAKVRYYFAKARYYFAKVRYYFAFARYYFAKVRYYFAKARYYFAYSKPSN